MIILRAAYFSATALLLSALLAIQLTAQVPDTTLGDTLLLTARAGGPSLDSLTLFLRRNGQYRIAVMPRGTYLRVVPVSGKAEAFVALGDAGDRNSTVFEVSPIVSGPHRLSLIPPLRRDTVAVWVWADRAREATVRARREREWGIGLAAAAGYHSGYRTHPDDPSAKATTDYEAGVLLGSSGRLSLLVGVIYDGRYAGSHSVTAVFGEPRVRLLRTWVSGRALMLEGLGRIAQGNSATIGVDPSFYAVGPLMTYHLDRRPGSRGWRVELQVTRNWVRNVPLKGQGFTRLGFGLSWLP